MSILSIIPTKSEQQIGSVYDPDALREFADGLYSRARSAVVWCATSYGLLAFAIGFSFGILAGRQMFESIPNLDTISTAFVLGALGAVIGIAVGIVKGREKSFDFKLEAQKILLQIRIEERTRKAVRALPD